MLFSQVRVKRQGHRCILDGPNPGLIIGDTGDFVPFVIEEETQFCMFSSIDMYNNDIGQESAQKFMKQTGVLKDATLYFAS